MSGLLALAMQVAAQSSSSRPEMSQERLNAMADASRAPRKWVELMGRKVVFRADPDADLVQIECMLRKISAETDLQNIGFIGNEQVSEDK